MQTAILEALFLATVLACHWHHLRCEKAVARRKAEQRFWTERKLRALRYRR